MVAGSVWRLRRGGGDPLSIPEGCSPQQEKDEEAQHEHEDTEQSILDIPEPNI